MSSMSLSSPVQQSSVVGGWGRYALVGLATVVAAVLANVIFFYLGGTVVNYDPDFIVLSNPSGAIVFTVFPAIIAVFLYAALLRFSSNPARTFTIISAVVLVLSIIPDYTYIPSQEGATFGQATILALMHVVAAAVIVWMLTTLTRPQSR